MRLLTYCLAGVLGIALGFLWPRSERDQHVVARQRLAQRGFGALLDAANSDEPASNARLRVRLRPVDILQAGRERLIVEMTVATTDPRVGRLRYGYQVVSRDAGPSSEPIISEIVHTPFDPGPVLHRRFEITAPADGFHGLHVNVVTLGDDGDSSATGRTVYFAAVRGTFWYVSSLGDWHAGCIRS